MRSRGCTLSGSAASRDRVEELHDRLNGLLDALDHAHLHGPAAYVSMAIDTIQRELTKKGGKVAITFDRMPHAGRVRGAWYISGCNGSGVALNTWLGHRVGQVLLGRAAPPAAADLRFPAIPLHRWRRAYLPAVGAWFRWADRE